MTYSLRNFLPQLATPNGGLVKTSKSRLMQLLEENADDHLVESLPAGNAIMIDAMAVIQTLKPLPQTFGDLATKILQLLMIMTRMSGAIRIDFVGDTYPEISIKNFERGKRGGCGASMIHISSASQNVPRQFENFLSVGKNKESLFEFFISIFVRMKTWQECSTMSHCMLHMGLCATAFNT